MDWSSVFNVSHPQPGASDATLAEFVAHIRRPISAAEARAVAASQSNPFPVSDPLHASYRPFDAAAWVVPNRPLPESYLSLLRWSDGGEFGTGGRWFQFFPVLDQSHGVRAMLLAYRLPQYMPGALPVAFNGGGVFYLLDMRRESAGGEYPVACAHAGNLEWGASAVVADSFADACRGLVNVEDVLRGDA